MSRIGSVVKGILATKTLKQDKVSYRSQQLWLEAAGPLVIKISQEIKELLTKDAIVEAQLSTSSYISQIFLVEKKGGGQRLVINLKASKTL